MGFEIENKYRVDTFESILSALTRLGLVPGAPELNEDLYLAHPVRDFAETGEAFRLRREGTENKITYKGPKLGGAAKTREELELSFESGDEAFESLRTLYERLGFREVTTVRKWRRTLELNRNGREMVVTLDDAESIGLFVEIETLVSEGDDLKSAQDAVQSLASDLGLSVVEPRSYLRMLLEHRGLMPKSPER